MFCFTGRGKTVSTGISSELGESNLSIPGMQSKEPTNVELTVSENVGGFKNVGGFNMHLNPQHNIDSDNGLVFVDVTNKFFTSEDPLESNGDTCILDHPAEKMLSGPQRLGKCHAGAIVGDIRAVRDVDVTTAFFPAADII
jgi:hypothetical protein